VSSAFVENNYQEQILIYPKHTMQYLIRKYNEKCEVDARQENRFGQKEDHLSINQKISL